MRDIAVGIGYPSGVPNIHFCRVVFFKVADSIWPHKVLDCGWNQSCS